MVQPTLTIAENAKDKTVRLEIWPSESDSKECEAFAAILKRSFFSSLLPHLQDDGSLKSDLTDEQRESLYDKMQFGMKLTDDAKSLHAINVGGAVVKTDGDRVKLAVKNAFSKGARANPGGSVDLRTAMGKEDSDHVNAKALQKAVLDLILSKEDLCATLKKQEATLTNKRKPGVPAEVMSAFQAGFKAEFDKDNSSLQKAFVDYATQLHTLLESRGRQKFLIMATGEAMIKEAYEETQTQYNTDSAMPMVMPISRDPRSKKVLGLPEESNTLVSGINQALEQSQPKGSSQTLLKATLLEEPNPLQRTFMVNVIISGQASQAQPGTADEKVEPEYNFVDISNASLMVELSNFKGNLGYGTVLRSADDKVICSTAGANAAVIFAVKQMAKLEPTFKVKLDGKHHDLDEASYKALLATFTDKAEEKASASSSVASNPYGAFAPPAGTPVTAANQGGAPAPSMGLK